VRRLTFDEIEAARRTRGRSALLFVTDRCPVGCAHCSVDSRRDSPTIIDFPLFERIVDGICADPELQIVGISGGEPFVERRGLELASRRIAEVGKELVVYTSGVWATSAEPAAWIRVVLRRSSCVFLSTDAFHAAQIQSQRFVRAAHAIAAEQVWIVVQVIDIADMVEQARALLHAAFAERWSEFAELNLTRPLLYGRGAAVFMQTKHTTPGHAFGGCLMAAAPVIRYDGLVSGCCNENVIMGGGPELLRRRCASEQQVSAALGYFRTDPLLGAIGGVGPGALTAHPRLADLADEQFASICDLCWRLLERTEADDRPDPLIAALDAVGPPR
jgi:organic radical activating enzyme